MEKLRTGTATPEEKRALVRSYGGRCTRKVPHDDGRRPTLRQLADLVNDDRSVLASGLKTPRQRAENLV
jgi:hypothetical protein